MINYFATLGFLSSIVLSTVGLFFIICIFKSKKLPMDKSNRINHIRLVWFVLTRPELFVKEFAWLTKDEFDNVKRNSDG